MEEQLISIIVPVYNVAPYLDACMNSIVTQSYQNLEIIVVDDGSTDGSSSICDKWKVTDERITVIHQENQGLSAARNEGMKHITGRYVAFADSDDILHPDMYLHLVRAIERTEADVAICQEILFYEEAFTFPECEERCEEEVEDRIQLLKHMTDAWSVPANVVWNKLYRRSLIGESRFLVGKKMEDTYFNIDVLSRVKKAVWIKQKLYGYRQRRGSIMNDGDDRLYLDYIEAILYQRNQIYRSELQELYSAFDSWVLRIIAGKRKQAEDRLRYGIASELKKIYIRTYNETNIKDLPIKDKVNIHLARYCFGAYCIVHRAVSYKLS